MSESTSSPQNTTSTSTQLTTNNLNASGNTGVTLVGGGDTTLTSLSHDESVTTIYNNTLDAGAVAAGVGLSRSAVDAVSNANNQSLSFATKQLSTTQDVLSGLNSKFIDAVSSFELNSQTTLANTVSTLNQIAKEQNQSANQLVVQASNDAQAVASETLTNVFKNVGYTVAAAGLIWLLSRKGGAFA